MKNITFYTLLSCLFVFPLRGNAQDEYVSAFQKGDVLINFGISPFTYPYENAYYSNTNYSSGMTLPPLTINIQYGFHDYVSGGITIGKYGRYYKREYPVYGTNLVEKYKSTYNYTLIGVMGEFHVANLIDNLGFTNGISDKTDLYAGLIVGTSIKSWKDKELKYNYNYSTLTYNPVVTQAKDTDINGLYRSYVGGRYYFSNNFAGFMELGYSGFGYMTIGVTLKL